MQQWTADRGPMDQYPIDRLLRMPHVGWQRFEALGDSKAVAYKGLLPDSSNAFLLVIRTRKGGQLPTTPPSSPNSTTGNICIGVWKSNQCVYVLVVPGSTRRYGQLIRSQDVAMGYWTVLSGV